MLRQRPRSRLTRSFGAFLLAIVIAGWLSPDIGRAEDWQPVAPGVDYRLYLLPDPNQVHVARLALSQPGLIVESSIGSGALAQGFETVSGMAERYDGSLLAWGGEWGPRADVLVAINGSSFDADTGYPYGGTFQSGWYAEEYGDRAGGTGFVWTDDGRGVVRGCVEHEDELQVVTHLRSGERFELDSVNQERDGNGLNLFTPQYGQATAESDRETEVILRVDRPVGVVAFPRYATATVLAVRTGGGETDLLFDEVVLAARGSAAQSFVEELRPGDQVGISRGITDLGFGCRRPSGFDWGSVYSGIGGGFVFLREGRIQESDDVGPYRREPRTAICLNSEYVYFVVVDGRNAGVSVGIRLDDLAEFCRDELDASWGLNQDGGGSSAMWVDGRIVNSPSDGTERGVANGLMMVAVEPPFRSRRFASGFEVAVRAPAEIRTGPGPGFPVLRVATPGQVARVAATAPSLFGVFVEGSYWWKTDVGGTIGFLPEQALVSGDHALADFRLPPPPLAEADG